MLNPFANNTSLPPPPSPPSPSPPHPHHHISNDGIQSSNNVEDDDRSNQSIGDNRSSSKAWIKFDENSNEPHPFHPNLNPNPNPNHHDDVINGVSIESHAIEMNRRKEVENSFDRPIEHHSSTNGIESKITPHVDDDDDDDSHFATIELSNSNIEMAANVSANSVITPKSINNDQNTTITAYNHQNTDTITTQTANCSNVFAAQISPSSSSVVTGASGSPIVSSVISNTIAASNTSGTSHFANGDIIVNLLPLNESCDWITPAKFKPNLVPEELMAQSLTLTVEEYVSTMSMLLNDYRFNFYIIFRKRVLGLWIVISLMVLLSILFSGWKGVPLFVAGMLWLISNAFGVFIAIFVKQKLNRMLEQCIAQVNAVFSRHNIFLGVDDRGRYSCHKVNLIFIYFDVKYCAKYLQDMLNNSEQSSSGSSNRQRPQVTFTAIFNNTLQQSIDTSDIVITGAVPRNISQREKYAEKLILRYSQRWIREYNRERMELMNNNANNAANTETRAVIEPVTAATIPEMMNNRQPHPVIADKNRASASTSASQSQSSNSIPIAARHCRSSQCFCQFIEQHLRYKPLYDNCCYIPDLFT